MTKLELNIGDFVELRNGTRVGPLKAGFVEGSFTADVNEEHPSLTGLWLSDDRADFFLSETGPEFDIVKVVTSLEKAKPTLKLSKQHNNILKHLRTAKGLTVREALIEYSISSLTKRVQELRGLGYDIESVRKKHPVTGQRYVRYFLLEEQEQ